MSTTPPRTPNSKACLLAVGAFGLVAFLLLVGVVGWAVHRRNAGAAGTRVARAGTVTPPAAQDTPATPQNDRDPFSRTGSAGEPVQPTTPGEAPAPATPGTNAPVAVPSPSTGTPGNDGNPGAPGGDGPGAPAASDGPGAPGASDGPGAPGGSDGPGAPTPQPQPKPKTTPKPHPKPPPPDLGSAPAPSTVQPVQPGDGEQAATPNVVTRPAPPPAPEALSWRLASVVQGPHPVAGIVTPSGYLRVRPGDRVGDAVLERIGPREVTLRRGQERFQLSLSHAPSARSKPAPDKHADTPGRSS